MATVFCKKTGYQMSRRFRRGYRISEDRCNVCGSGLTRKGTNYWDLPEDECKNHDCYAKGIKGIDLGIVRERVWSGSHLIPGPAYTSYCDYRGYQCPECGHKWEVVARSWREYHETKAVQR